MCGWGGGLDNLPILMRPGLYLINRVNTCINLGGEKQLQ